MAVRLVSCKEQEWTYGLITRYNVYWRDLIDAMVITLVKEVAGTLLWNTDHRGPGHLRAPANGVGHSSSEAMDEESSVPLKNSQARPSTW